MKLDAIDRRLLRILQSDAKTNIKEIAEQLNMTKTPIYERIKRYEREGLIDRYVALLNPKKISSGMIIFCSVTLENQKLEALESFGAAIGQIPEVLECYLMGGANDFLLKVVVKDLDDYHQFSSGILAALPYVAQIRSTFVLNKMKQSTVMPIFES